MHGLWFAECKVSKKLPFCQISEQKSGISPEINLLQECSQKADRLVSPLPNRIKKQSVVLT